MWPIRESVSVVYARRKKMSIDDEEEEERGGGYASVVTVSSSSAPSRIDRRTYFKCIETCPSNQTPMS